MTLKLRVLVLCGEALEIFTDLSYSEISLINSTWFYFHDINHHWYFATEGIYLLAAQTTEAKLHQRNNIGH